MSIHIPMARALLWQTLARNQIPSIGHKRYRKLHKYNVQSRVHEVRRFSVGTNKMDEDDSQKVRRDVSLVRRRPLSPLERISQLLPQESLGPEVEQLRDCNDDRTDESLAVTEDSNTLVASDKICESDTPIKEITMPQEEITHLSNGRTVADCSDVQSQVGAGTPSHVAEPLPKSLPRETMIEFGELLVAEFRKKGRVEFRKMFQLQEGVRLQSSWGTINHDDMAGRPSGRIMRTTHWAPILIRRPSLEDYVLLMKRGPAIAYPKDASMMLTMMDVVEGDCVLESGSGSGAMSLFLSRAVGSKGTVLSVEVREDHLGRSVKNYKRWRSAWARRRGGEEWPDNVHFHHADLSSASSLLAGRGFHSVALDLISPQLVLPTVVPHLHPGAVCAVYLANITQVVDLLDGIRCSSLPLLCERIIEVPVRDWLVAPARQKDGDFCTRKSPLSNEDKKDLCGVEEKGESANDARPFGSVPYISRPHPEQLSHTAFLVKLRKYVQ
ncbi:unnamed protein product [Arctogadus glacialis]